MVAAVSPRRNADPDVFESEQLTEWLQIELGNKIRRACLLRCLTERGIVVLRENDDTRRWRACHDARCRGEAILPRHGNVHQHHVGLL